MQSNTLEAKHSDPGPRIPPPPDAVVGAVLVIKLFCLDSFRPRLELEVDQQQIPDSFPMLARLPRRYYLVSREEVSTYIASLSDVDIDNKRQYLAISGHKCAGFRTTEWHGVKGDVLYEGDASNSIYFYSFNQRFDIPYDVPLQAEPAGK